MTVKQWILDGSLRDSLDHPIFANGSKLSLKLDPEYDWTSASTNCGVLNLQSGDY